MRVSNLSIYGGEHTGNTHMHCLSAGTHLRICSSPSSPLPDCFFPADFLKPGLATARSLEEVSAKFEVIDRKATKTQSRTAIMRDVDAIAEQFIKV